MASKQNPVYTVYAVSGSTKYNLTPAIVSLDMSDQENQISKSVRIALVNIKVGDSWLTNILKLRDRVFIHADDGERNEEVWRGFIWTRSYKSSLDGFDFELKCYDNLIYFQESEESEFFEAGKSTEAVISALCSKWGVSLSYSYESITHSKLALRGNLADIITADVLDLVKDRTGKKYVVLSDKDVVQVKPVGSNSTVYTLQSKKNAIYSSFDETMDGMVTKVVILGKADDDDRTPVEATVKGNTDQYGTLQKLKNRDENTALADAKKEAQKIIDEDGKPKWEGTVRTIDIPWIRKGDKVLAKAGALTTYYIVNGIERDITNDAKQMTLTLVEV